jgi:hypothetical protein
MKKMMFPCLALAILLMGCRSHESYDIVIFGGTASGTAAGIQAARSGARVLLCSETSWLGGMLTSAGVSCTDGNYHLRSGLWGELIDSLCFHYGSIEALHTNWVSNISFEPSVGNQIFKNMCSKEHDLTVLYNTSVSDIRKVDDKGWDIIFSREEKPSVHVRARIIVDATELGDIAKMCGTGYDIGMESKSVTGEEVAPEKANSIVADMTYVAILKDYGHEVEMARPEGYDSTEFALSCVNSMSGNKEGLWSADMMMTYGKLQNGKYMINWPGEGGNDYYANIIDSEPAHRAEVISEAKKHTLRFVYFIHDYLGYRNIGIADDEYPTSDKMPFYPYYRESRRIHGLVRFNSEDMEHPFRNNLYRTSIAVGDYPVDQHHSKYNGEETIPDLHFHPIPSFGVPMGVLIPKDVDDLIVAEKSISVSNIANGATRLQPVVLQIGQAAGALAALCADRDLSPKDIDVRSVQNILLDAGGYLMPYIDVPKESPIFKACQRIGATGILRGEGRSVGWSNETRFYPDSLLSKEDLTGIKEIYSNTLIPEECSASNILNMISAIAEGKKIDIDKDKIQEALEEAGIYETSPLITRAQCAILLDRLLDPFNSIRVDANGDLADSNIAY